VILLDTNVVSEWMKREPEPAVIAWLDRQVASRLFISAVTRAEIETGIGILPEGRRKTTLTAAAAVVLKDFEQRCLAFDCDCAMRYGAIITESRHLGRPISVEDAQIGAIALRYSFQLATRNISDFDFLGDLDLINPWTQTRPASAP
jgi:toxin FitB